jgi:hypothetical protein
VEKPVPGEVEVSIGDERRRSQLWQGTPPMSGAVVLDEGKIGPGPAQIPLRVQSAAGMRDYVLFLPVMARLGESAAQAPTGRIEGETLSEVFARFSAMTGLIILAEEPLTDRISRAIPEGAPSASLEQIGREAGLKVEREGDLVLNFTQSRDPE